MYAYILPPPHTSVTTLTFLHSTMNHHHLLLLLLYSSTAATAAATEIALGFSATPPPTPSAFHPLLTDPTATFALGFLPAPASGLRIAVVHLPSSTPLWLSPAAAPWRPSSSLRFDGTLQLLSPPLPASSVTPSAAPGRLLRLLPSSNLQLLGAAGAVLWQSFDHPAHTLVQGQNFSSAVALSSPDSRFFFKLGPNFMALYLNSTGAARRPTYFKESVWEIRAPVRPSGGPLYARIDPSGYLGLYQAEAALVHLVPFSTYRRNVSVALWRLTAEPDGNLRGYYWNASAWVAGYEAIANACDLPSACGAYGLCTPEGTAGTCRCLDAGTGYSAGADCSPPGEGTLCGGEVHYRVLRRSGVTLAYKEELGYTTTASMAECEGQCERNCSCWGAIYSNATGACYVMDFPVETMVEEGEGREGYFKVRVKRRRGHAAWRAVAVGGVAVCAAAVGVYVFLLRRRQRQEGPGVEEGLAPVPYKGLRESPSFGDVELPPLPGKQ